MCTSQGLDFICVKYLFVKCLSLSDVKYCKVVTCVFVSICKVCMLVRCSTVFVL